MSETIIEDKRVKNHDHVELVVSGQRGRVYHVTESEVYVDFGRGDRRCLDHTDVRKLPEEGESR